MKFALLSALAVSALCRVAYVSAAHDPRVTFLQQPPDCALWSTRDGGCFATPAEFVHGRHFSQRTRDAGGSP